MTGRGEEGGGEEGGGEERGGEEGAGEEGCQAPAQVTVVVAVLSQGGLDGEHIWEKRLSSVLVVFPWRGRRIRGGRSATEVSARGRRWEGRPGGLAAAGRSG